MAPRRRLPDLCGIALLKMMPPADQLRAGRMNKRWTGLLRAANRRVRSLKILCFKENPTNENIEFLQSQINSLALGGTSRSMQMLKDKEGKPEYPVTGRLTKWNCLINPIFSKDTEKDEGANTFSVQQIANAFSAITDLTFATICPKDFAHLVDLLEQHPALSRQLTSFTLIDNKTFRSCALSSVLNDRLFAAINTGMPSLQRLTISWEDGLKMPDDLSVIAQLNFLSADCPKDNINALFPSLNRYAADAVDLQVILKSYSDGIDRLNEHARNRIVCLSSFTTPYYSGNKLLHCNALHSLVSFKIFSSSHFIAKNFDALSQLTQLVHLDLTVNLSNDELTSPTAVLRSVRALDLSSFITDHKQNNWLNLGRTLPNLEVIHLKSLYCVHCHVELIELSKYEAATRATALQCFRSVLPQTGLPLSQILLDLPNYRTAEEVCTIAQEE